MQSNTKIDEVVNVFADLEGKCRREMNRVYELKHKMYIGIGLDKNDGSNNWCSIHW